MGAAKVIVEVVDEDEDGVEFAVADDDEKERRRSWKRAGWSLDFYI